MQIDPRASKELILPPRRNCLRNVFANGKRRGGGSVCRSQLEGLLSTVPAPLPADRTRKKV